MAFFMTKGINKVLLEIVSGLEQWRRAGNRRLRSAVIHLTGTFRRCQRAGRQSWKKLLLLMEEMSSQTKADG